MRSFRSALALRVAVQALLLATAVLIGASLLLRVHLISNIDATLLEFARFNAEEGASRTGSEFHFRPDAGLRSEPEPTGQIVLPDGTTGARSANLTEPLPVPPRALGEARRGAIGYETHLLGREPVRSIIYPLARLAPAHQGHLLQLTTSLAPAQTALGRFVRLAVLFGLVTTGLAWFAGWTIAGRALEPALAITAEAESIGVNQLGRRVVEPRDLAEFSRMAVAFNALLARLERAVTGTRRFTSDASHELRAPLTVLRGELELALTRPRGAAEYEEVLGRCLDEVLRLTRLADDLLTLARVEGGVVGQERAAIELEEVVERAVARKAALAGGRGVTVTVTGTAGPVSADADLLVRAVDGLLEHAIMASPPGSTVRMVLGTIPEPSLEVIDAGTGIPREEVSGIFQRFYRSNRRRVASHESGLGLPIARAVAETHGGALDYTGNAPGASFRLHLPRASG